MHCVKLVVLGAQGVGKTSLIQQFLESHFTRDHKATQLTTNNENCFTFTMILNGTLYEVRILDMPLINYFPSNTLYEWTDYRGYALRRANGYLLVFDLTSPESFQYVKVIRDQLVESRNMQNIPIYVVGNKADLCFSVLNTMRGSGHSHQPHSHHSHLHHHNQHHNHPVVTELPDMTPAFKELASLVKKQWKCSYLECSAKYSWRVTPILKDILRTIDLNQFKVDNAAVAGGHHKERDHGTDSHRDSLKLSIGSTSNVGCLPTVSGAHSLRISNPLRTSRTSNHNNERSTNCVIF